MEKKKCRIIYNPVTSGFKQKVLDKVCFAFDGKYDVDAVKSEYKGHAVEIANESNKDADLIVSYGGDGTFGELIKGVYDEEQGALISHIPIGTANDLQRNFGLSKDPVKSAELIANGTKEDLDIFTVNGVPFSYVAAFGYFANVPCNTPTELKKRLKYLAYLLVGIKEFKEQKPFLYDMTLKYDGKEVDEKAIVGAFSNSTGFGGMSLFDNPILDDNKFEVTLVKDIPKLQMLKIAKDIVTGKFKISNYPDIVNHFSTSELEIKFNNQEPSDPIDLDGDAFNVSNNNGIYVLQRGKSLKMQVPKR